MSTIVTYNRGAQGAPFAQSSFGDFSGAASFSTDFVVDPGFTVSGFGLIADRRGGVFGNNAGGSTSTFLGPLFLFAATSGKEFSWAMRARLGGRNTGDIATLGVSDAASADVTTGNANMSFKVTQGSTAATDVIQISLDDGVDSGLVTITNPAGYDSEVYSVFSGHAKYDGTKTTFTWFIDGAQVHQIVRTGATISQGESMGLAGGQTAETALLELDWAGCACSERD